MSAESTRAARPSTAATAGDAPDLTGRDAYRAISLYAPDRAPCAVDLSDNTNLWGIPPAAAESLRSAASATVTRYPSLYANDLKRELARYASVSSDAVVTGCGSDDILDSAIRAFAEPGDRVVFPDPSFMMIPLFARMNALEPVSVPLTASLDIDADAMLAARGRITYICSPNNPTGTLASRDAVRRVIDEAEGLVIIDEAYAEFASDDIGYACGASERVLSVRTMSKAFGLAGLRIGYGIGHPRVVAEVEKSRGPYKVNALAERAAVAALSSDMAWVRAHIAEARGNRERLSDALAVFDAFDIVPSAANFVLASIRQETGLRAAEIARDLRAAGIAVRPFPALPGIGDAVRITVGPWEMMERCLSALAPVLEGRKPS